MKPKQVMEHLENIKHEIEYMIKNFKFAFDDIFSNKDIQALDHAINCVGAIEQIKWERDIAISQLHELGLELGQKTDEVQRAIQHFNNLKKIAKGSDKE